MTNETNPPADSGVVPVDYEAVARNNCRILGDLLQQLSTSHQQYSTTYTEFLEVYRNLSKCLSAGQSPEETLNWPSQIVDKLGKLKTSTGEVRQGLKVLEDNNQNLENIHAVLEVLLYTDSLRFG